MSKLEDYAEEMEFKKIVISMILGAFGFLLALQWRDVIKETIEMYMPPGEGLIYKYAIALGITVLLAIVTIVLLKVQKMNIVPDHLEPHKRVAMELKKRKEAKKK